MGAFSRVGSSLRKVPSSSSLPRCIFRPGWRTQYWMSLDVFIDIYLKDFMYLRGSCVILSQLRLSLSFVSLRMCNSRLFSRKALKMKRAFGSHCLWTTTIWVKCQLFWVWVHHTLTNASLKLHLTVCPHTDYFVKCVHFYVNSLRADALMKLGWTWYFIMHALKIHTDKLTGWCRYLCARCSEVAWAGGKE